MSQANISIRVARKAGMQAFETLRREAEKNGLQQMTLEEINAEITAARDERKNGHEE